MARSEPIQPTPPSTPTTAMTRNRHRATATRRTTEARAPTRATPASLVATVVTDVGRSVIVVHLVGHADAVGVDAWPVYQGYDRSLTTVAGPRKTSRLVLAPIMPPSGRPQSWRRRCDCCWALSCRAGRAWLGNRSSWRSR